MAGALSREWVRKRSSGRLDRGPCCRWGAVPPYRGISIPGCGLWVGCWGVCKGNRILRWGCLGPVASSGRKATSLPIILGPYAQIRARSFLGVQEAVRPRGPVSLRLFK